MATKKEKAVKTASKQSVVFSFDAHDARAVLILGDFNGWDQKRGAMKKNQKGLWYKTLLIAPGTYQYKFLVDGEWQNDPECNETTTNIHGTLNSVLRVATEQDV